MGGEHNALCGAGSAKLISVQDNEKGTVPTQTPTKSPAGEAFFHDCASTYFNLALIMAYIDPMVLPALAIFPMLFFGGTP